MSGSPIHVVNGAALGTSPPAATFGPGATDMFGQVALGSGTATSAGVICTLQPGIPLNGAGAVPAAGAGISVFPMNAATAALGPFYAGWDAPGANMTISCSVAPAASQAAGTYRLSYTITT